MRKIESISDIRELGLDGNSAHTIAIHGYTIPVIITAARCEELKKLEGIGDRGAERIMLAVDRAGFILHESTLSLRVRTLLATAFYFPLGTIEEYEARTEFTAQQGEALLKTLQSMLTEQEYEALILRFGLHDAEPMSLRGAAAEMNISGERVRQVEAKALRKLRHPSRKAELKKIFPEWTGFEMAIPRRTGKYDGPIEEMPLEELPCLSVPAYNCLVRAKIYNVGQLIQHTNAEVEAIRNMTRRGVGNIVASLLGVGCTLKMEPNPEEISPD